MNWFGIITSFLVIFVISFYWGYKASFTTSDWLQFLIFWIMAVVALPSISNWRLQDRDFKLIHSKELCKELQIMENSYIDLNFDKNNLKIYVKQMTDELISKPKRVFAHLENSRYKNIYDLIERRDFYIKLHNNTELPEFLKRLKLKIISDLQQNIPNIIDWDESNQLLEPTKYYSANNLSEIGVNILSNYKRRQRFFFEEVNEINKATTKYKLCLNGVFLVVSNDIVEIQKVNEIIKKDFEEYIDSWGFKILKGYFEEIETEHDKLKEELLNLIDEVNSGGILEGHCDLKICRGI